MGGGEGEGEEGGRREAVTSGRRRRRRVKRLKSRMYTTEDGAMGEGGVTCRWWFSTLASQALLVILSSLVLLSRFIVL